MLQAERIELTAERLFSSLCREFQLDEHEIQRMPKNSVPTVQELRTFWTRVRAEAEALVAIKAVVEQLSQKISRRLDDVLTIHSHPTRSESFRLPQNTTPFDSLPDDLLVTILLVAQNDRSRYAHPHVTRHLWVCRRWYHLLSNEGRFWSGFQLVFDLQSSSAPGARRLLRMETPVAIERRLRLSRQAPLSIAVEEWNEKQHGSHRSDWMKNYEPQFRLLLKEATRWKDVSLRIMSPNHWLMFRPELQTAESLYLHVIVYSPWADRSPGFSMNAKRVHIQGWKAPELLSGDPLPFQQVEDLTVTLWNLQTLSGISPLAFRRLRRLRLDVPSHEPVPWSPAASFLPPGCVLPFLVSLTLENLPQVACEATLSAIDAPFLSSLHYATVTSEPSISRIRDSLSSTLTTVGTKWSHLTELRLNLRRCSYAFGAVIDAADFLRDLRILDLELGKEIDADADSESRNDFGVLLDGLDAPQLRHPRRGSEVQRDWIFPNLSVLILRLQSPISLLDLIRVAKSRASSSEVATLTSVRMYHVHPKKLVSTERVIERRKLALYVSVVDAR